MDRSTVSYSIPFHSGKEPYPSPAALLKARIDLGSVLLIISGSSLPEPIGKYLVHVGELQVCHVQKFLWVLRPNTRPQTP
jgi:hypothetical protein